MRHLILSVGLILSSLVAYSQSSPRTILYEGFTNASSGPDATYNPDAQNELNTTSVDVVQLMYHTSWPGVDPMYSHNPSDCLLYTSDAADD